MTRDVKHAADILGMNNSIVPCLLETHPEAIVNLPVKGLAFLASPVGSTADTEGIPFGNASVLANTLIRQGRGCVFDATERRARSHFFIKRVCPSIVRKSF